MKNKKKTQIHEGKKVYKHISGRYMHLKPLIQRILYSSPIKHFMAHQEDAAIKHRDPHHPLKPNEKIKQHFIYPFYKNQPSTMTKALNAQLKSINQETPIPPQKSARNRIEFQQ